MSFLRIVLLIESLAVFAVVGVSCSRSTQVAGWGSETTNGVTAAVVRQDGTPAAGAVVRVRKSDFVTQPPADLAKTSIYSADALTDELGRFEIKGIDPGSYSVEVRDSAAAVLLTCSIEINDTVNFHTDTLRPLASVRGSIDTSGMNGKRLFVQVCGLERLVSVDSAGAFTIKDLPAGLFSLHVISVAGTQSSLIRTDQVSAVAGDTVPVTMSGWSFSRKVYLNTTSSGAAISGDVRDFPVLIRLTNTNFDFSQAKSDGGDIRFSKADTTTLPYEIERWDASSQAAEIWVRVDTVYGNNSSQYIVMYWGDSSASSLSNGPAVFDTAGGFQCVWHLGQEAAGFASDATANHFNGTPSTPAPTVAMGAIGMCQQFNGTSNYFQALGTASGKLNFPAQGTYALSAWVYADTLDSAYTRIIEKNDFQYKLQVDWVNNWQFSEYENTRQFDLTNYPATARAWVYLVGVRFGGSQYLYVNGILAASTISALANAGPRDTTSNVTVGRSALNYVSPGCFFKGRLDEIRIENTAPSADWVKLSYMNQKADDALVLFK